MLIRKSLKYSLCLSLFLILGTRSAHAYLDPGSGSYLLQIILGGILAGIFSVKHFGKKIKQKVSDHFDKVKDGQD